MKAITRTMSAMRFGGVGRLLVVPLLCLGGYAGAQSAPATLESVSHSILPGDRVQIELSFDGPVKAPGSFTIDNPARIALDFPGVKARLPSRSVSVDTGSTRDVTAIEAGGRTRVVIGLVRPAPFDTRVEGNNVYVTVESGGAPQSRTRNTVKTPQSAGESAVREIDFRRGKGGEGRVIVTLSDPGMSVDMQRDGNAVKLHFADQRIDAELERRLDVSDFATPVQTVDAYNQSRGAAVVITAGEDFEHIAYQTDEQFVVELQALTQKAEAEAGPGKTAKYTGEPLSLNFQSIEVRAVLQLLADFTGLNMVTSDTVKGNLTLRLKNVPWDQALDIILKSKGLGMRQDGNVVMVAPADEIAAREKLELEAAKQVSELAPLRSRSIQVNYAKASEIAGLLKSKEGSLLSGRGNITVDERTNKLLVQDTSDSLEAIANLVQELDVPVRQVLIESRIVLATDDFSKELGVRFGMSRLTSADGDDLIISGSHAATNEILNGDDLTSPDRLNVNLPATSSSAGTLGLALAKLPFGTLLELELSAAQAEGRSETVSSPKVITANQQEAVIETGTEIPYQQATSSGATSVSFKKAVLSLTVTPQITPDDRIIMDLEVTKDAPNFGNSVLGVPPIDTQSVTTQVLVDNGETVVLGGVYEQTKSHVVNRIPFFGDLPIVGVLFRNKLSSDSKSELLVFVTPKILKEKVRGAL